MGRKRTILAQNVKPEMVIGDNKVKSVILHVGFVDVYYYGAGGYDSWHNGDIITVR